METTTPDSSTKTIRYAGVWRRLAAALIDGIILALVGYVLMLGLGYSVAGDVTLLLLILGLNLAYGIFMVEKFGATAGKMMLDLQIRKVDMQPVGFKDAVLRYSVNIALGAVNTCLTIGVAISIPGSGGASWTERVTEFAKTPAGTALTYFTFLPLVWGLVLLVAMIMSDRKRTIHDYIAGTLVIIKKDD